MRVRWDLVPKLPQPQVWAPAFREWVWAITGFTLVADGTNVFSTSTVVTGKVYGATHAVPTPATLSTANDDQLTAYNDAAGLSDRQVDSAN